MRLFVALDIDDSIRSRIARFMEGVQIFAPEARWIRPESLHVTLKFIGEQPESLRDRIEAALRTIPAMPITVGFRGYGFFPIAQSPRVFWVALEAPPELASLAASVDDKVSALGISKEDRAYSPHLTLARGGTRGSGNPKVQKGDKPNRNFQRLQEKLSGIPQPDFGTMTAHEFFLYRSELSPKGSKYSKLAAFKLSR
jgi:2'-5' RNA ligase